MCGRYQLALPGQTIANLLDAQLAAGNVQPTWNAAPTQVLPILTLADDGGRLLQPAQWGLVPSWARRPGSTMRPPINARAETVMEKPAFRSAFQRGRVLVPVTAFYEWSGAKGSKVPYVLRVRGAAVDPERGVRLDHVAAIGETAEPFLIAGLAEWWQTQNGEQEATFTLLTTTPNETCAPIHDRMPVILDGDDAQAWLEMPPAQSSELLDLLRPYPADKMETWAVSRAVNDVRLDGPELGIAVDADSLAVEAAGEADELRLL